jgi:hypothetical protein
MNMSISHRTSRLLLVAALLLVTAHRLPAPIQEVPESPTPTPEQSVGTPTTLQSQQRTARFAGTWAGKVSEGKLGDVDVTLVINADATALEQKSKMATFVRPTTHSGNTLSWTAGRKGEVAWTLTLNRDGQTALVTRQLGGVNTTATFKRMPAGQGPSAAPVQKKSRPNAKPSQPSG